MYLQVSGVKTDSRKNMEQTGVASFLSRHLSRYGNQHSQYHTDALSNSSLSFNMKSFTPCFTHHSSLVCDFVKSPKQSSTTNDRRMAPYSDISNINILSYLVGGFVGSKSLTVVKGSSIQIWDIVLNKIYDMMNDHIVCSEDLDHKLSNTENLPSSPIIENPCSKKTYASVMKMNPSIKPCDEYADLVMKFDNSRRTRRRGKKTSSANRNDKKMNYVDRSYSNSSRWSNSRKKHCKKGTEKFNRRDKLEAAKDGLDFINQELDRDHQCNRNVSCKRSCITDKIMENLQMKGVTASESSSPPSRNRSTSSATLNNSSFNNIKSNFDKEKDCDRQQLIACKMKLDGENENVSVKPRANSESSIESEDSFIVFESTDADNISCFSLESDDSSCESDDDDSDPDSDICSACIFYGNSKFNDAVANRSGSVFDNAVICLICKKNHKEHFDFPHSCDRVDSSCNSFPSPKTTNRLNRMPDDKMPSAFADTEDRSEASCTKCINYLPNSDDEDIPFYSVIDESLLPTYVDPIVTDIAAACDYDYQLSQLSSYEDHLYSVNNHYSLINRKWREIFCDDNNNTNRKSSKTGKKVSFAPDDKLVRVKTMRTWDYASRSARLGPWEELARDSMRFSRRVSRTEAILRPILSGDHRTKIWHERFERPSSDSGCK